MAIIWTICEKKQSGFIKDFPLSDEFNNNRICAYCNDEKSYLLKNASMNNEIYKEKREYFSNILTGKNREYDDIEIESMMT